jgi:hypothetical protein
VGLLGAGIASSSTVHWSTGVVGKVIIPMILSPTVSLLRLSVDGDRLVGVRNANPHRVDRGFRIAHGCFSAPSLALGHGLQDAQQSKGIIVLSDDGGLSGGLRGAMGCLGLRARTGGRDVLGRAGESCEPLAGASFGCGQCMASSLRRLPRACSNSLLS